MVENINVEYARFHNIIMNCIFPNYLEHTVGVYEVVLAIFAL